MKICAKCNSTENYYAKGLCHKCYNNTYSKKWYQENKEQVKADMNKFYKENKEQCLQGMKEYANKNKEKLSKYYHEYYLKNYDKLTIEGAVRYQQMKHIWNKTGHLRKKEKLKQEPGLKLRDVLHSRMGAGILHHKGTKYTSSLELLGVDNINIVRKHIENQFKPGMSWNNHGRKGWHIDHIISCSKFDLSKIEEQKKCFHYTNLQPLWYEENLRKDRKDLLHDEDYYKLKNFRAIFSL